MPVKWAYRRMNFSLSKLVEVAEEFKDMGAAATGERKRRTVVLQVLTERVPVATLLVLVAAWSGGG